MSQLREWTVLKRARSLVAIVALGLVLLHGTARAATQIEYWQYTFKERVDAMDELIRRFQAANPDITVKQVTVPYDNFRARVAAAVSAGEGPDVVQLYYGWLDAYISANLLQKLPADQFDPAQIDRDFYPITQLMKRDGAYYALPTAVRALALFWNKKLFQEAGIAAPPQTLDELVADAQKLTKRDAGGNMLVEGFATDMNAQDANWLRDVLIRQFGGTPYSADGRTPTFDSPGGIAAVAWYADLVQKYHVGEFGFMTDQATAFKAQRAAMTVDGSFRVSGFDAQRGLDYGIAELPSRNGIRGNFASYWVNGVTAKATGAKRDAAFKFLTYLTSPEAMQIWVKTVGELPARPAVANLPDIVNNPKYGPFVRGLAYATTTIFADESRQRTEFIDMIDRIVLQHMPVAQSVAMAQAEDKKIIAESGQK